MCSAARASGVAGRRRTSGRGGRDVAGGAHRTGTERRTRFHVKHRSGVARRTSGRPAGLLWMNWGQPVDNCAQRASPDRWITRSRSPDSGRSGAAVRWRRPSRGRSAHRPGTAGAAASAATRRRKRPTYPRRIGPGHPDHRGRWTTTVPAPSVEHLGRRAPAAGASVGRAPPRSPRATEPPFIATSAPVGATSGIDQPSSRSSGATAREVTTSNVRSPCSASARPRTTSTVVERRARRPPPRGRWSGAAAARPASPAGPGGRSPAPARAGRRRSRCRTPWRPRGISSASTAQFSRCRSQSRGASRGPISPRTTPSVASSSAYRSASAQPLGRRTPPAPPGAAAVGGCFT